jgi:hypothetical protein
MAVHSYCLAAILESVAITTSIIMRRKDPKMQKGWNKIKQKFEENPLQVILIGSIAITAVAKLIDAQSAAKGRRAYAESVRLRARGL